MKSYSKMSRLIGGNAPVTIPIVQYHRDNACRGLAKINRVNPGPFTFGDRFCAPKLILCRHQLLDMAAALRRG